MSLGPMFHARAVARALIPLDVVNLDAKVAMLAFPRKLRALHDLSELL